MRLLFDQNLSRRLVEQLAPWFPDSTHIGSHDGLDTATDHEVWAFVGEHGYMIVSKDSDFRQLAFPVRTAAQGGVASRRQLLHGDDRRGPARRRRCHGPVRADLPGVVAGAKADSAFAAQVVAAMGMHRHWDRLRVP